MPGQSTSGRIEMNADIPKRKALTVDDCVAGVLEGNRTMLARTITMIESDTRQHSLQAKEIVQKLLPYAGKSMRVGITGVPGAGKSTLIEALGTWLCHQGKKVAVLAVDPSSTVSGGSILGDKTRMEMLSRHPNAFIRPSPSGGNLGGVTRKSRETIVACEAFGFDVVLIETVGVGQSETTVRSMVDFFLLVLVAGAGDELQGIKRGVVELADAILINKADGDNKVRAGLAQREYASAIHYLTPATPGWTPEVQTASALTSEGIPELWTTIEKFFNQTRESGEFRNRRESQRIDWVHAMIEQELKRSFYENPAVGELMHQVLDEVRASTRTTRSAAEVLLEAWHRAR